MAKTLNRYVPKDVISQINTLNYKNTEHLYIVCDMIYRISNYHKKEIDHSNQYIDIPLHYFTDIITSDKSYYKAKKYLIENKIIECDNLYSKKNGKALGYRFPNNLLSKLDKVTIAKSTLVKRIIKNKNERNNYVNDMMKPARNHFLDTFDIDYNQAVNHIDQEYQTEIRSADFSSTLKAINRWNAHYMSIVAIKEGDLFFTKNKTNGRVDSNITNLKSELKQFITTKGLVQIDIVNSQPYLLSLILRDKSVKGVDNEEVMKYANLTSNGTFYEYMMNIKYGTSINQLTEVETKQRRKEIKNIMFCVYYSKNTSYKKEKSMFKKEFPTIMNWINLQKKEKHNVLAIMMQSVESQICIDIITPELNKAGIKYYTIHDAWLVDHNAVTEATAIIEKCFKSKYNECPKFDIKMIN